MVKTSCIEGFIGRNAASAINNSTIKKVWVITVDASAHFWGGNAMTDIPSRSFGSNISWLCKKWYWPTKCVQQNFPFAKPGLLDCLQTLQHIEYEGYLSAADAAFRNGRVASTQKVRKKCKVTMWKSKLVIKNPKNSTNNIILLPIFNSLLLYIIIGKMASQ